MSLYARKRIKLGSGINLNISKSGTSLSFGPKGSKVNIGHKGTYITTGIPGTGIYSRKKISRNNIINENNNNEKISVRSVLATIFLIASLFLEFSTSLSWSFLLPCFFILLYFMFGKSPKQMMKDTESEYNTIYLKRYILVLIYCSFAFYFIIQNVIDTSIAFISMSIYCVLLDCLELQIIKYKKERNRVISGIISSLYINKIN